MPKLTNAQREEFFGIISRGNKTEAEAWLKDMEAGFPPKVAPKPVVPVVPAKPVVPVTPPKPVAGVGTPAKPAAPVVKPLAAAAPIPKS